MKTFHERLSYIIDKDFFGKPANLAKTADLQNSLLSRWLNGVSTPTLEKLASLEKLGYNIKWLLYGEGDMQLQPELKQSTQEPSNVVSEPQVVYPKRTNIELLPVPANAGKGYDFEPSAFTYEVPSAFSLERYKAIRISGDSMHPTIPNESIVIFDTHLTEPTHNRIVIAIVDGVLYCKRVHIDADNARHLVSDNKDYETIKVNGFHNTKILGTAIEVKYYL
ncbi:MAG: LexA family transcriptional regulator [Desulfobulbaceae bacterium]|nr:LexA family transcriptional regulator [Desulfobulbaceae bacterium]